MFYFNYFCDEISYAYSKKIKLKFVKILRNHVKQSILSVQKVLFLAKFHTISILTVQEELLIYKGQDNSKLKIPKISHGVLEMFNVFFIFRRPCSTGRTAAWS